MANTMAHILGRVFRHGTAIRRLLIRASILTLTRAQQYAPAFWNNCPNLCATLQRLLSLLGALKFPNKKNNRATICAIVFIRLMIMRRNIICVIANDNHYAKFATPTVAVPQLFAEILR
jgi:hypothetical protein